MTATPKYADLVPGDIYVVTYYTTTDPRRTVLPTKTRTLRFFDRLDGMKSSGKVEHLYRFVPLRNGHRVPLHEYEIVSIEVAS